MSARKSSSEADGPDSPSAHVQSSTAKTGKQSSGGSPPNTRQGGQATPQRQPSLGGNSTQSQPATRREDAELSPRNSLKETGPATSRHSTSRIKTRASDGVDSASETTSAAENKRGLEDVEKLSQAARSRSSTHREKERTEDKHFNPEVTEEKDKEDEKSASDSAFNSDVLGIERYSSCSRVDAAGARAVLDFGPEGCSCFPSRSSHTVPSMLYDQVHCLHCHVTGHAHVGVFQFDDNWDANVRNVKSTDRHLPTKKYISGYPYSSSLLKLEDTSMITEREATPAPPRGETTPVPVTVETPSRVASQSSLVQTYSRNTTPAGEFVSRSRTFRGQFYDPATDECYIFDINPDFGRQLDQWNAHKELTRQRTRGTKQTKGDNY